MWDPLFSGLPSNSKLNLRMRHLAMTENHKYISNLDDLKKTWGKEEQTSDNDSEQRWGLMTYFHLRAKSFIFCCSLLCEKISEWFRLKTKLNWVISTGRCTSSSWYKTNLTTSSQTQPINSRVPSDIYDDTSHCSSSHIARKKLAKLRQTGEREMSSGI